MKKTQALAIQMGVDSDQILLTEIVENTADEAQAVLELTKIHGISSDPCNLQFPSTKGPIGF